MAVGGHGLMCWVVAIYKEYGLSMIGYKPLLTFFQTERNKNTIEVVWARDMVADLI